MADLEEAGLGRVSEIADAPHGGPGCPFQAWSVGELLRTLALVQSAPTYLVSRNQSP